MLGSFLKVAYANEKRDEEQAQLVEKMAGLPDELLHKIVSGEEKLAYIGGFGDDCWIEKYKGTPLFEQAIELEKQELQSRMAESARRTEDSEKFRAQDAARDELCIQKKLLDLQLLEQEAGVGQGEEEVPEEGVPGEAPPDAAPGGEEDAALEEAPPEEVPAEEPPAEEVPPAAAEAPPAAPPAPAAEKPKVDVKVAAAGMRMGLFKVAKEGPEGHHIRRALLGNPTSAFIEAEKGKKMKAFGGAYKENLKNVVKGGLGGAAIGAATGALKSGKKGALTGAMIGGGVGSVGGSAYGQHGPKASEIHGRSSKEKKAEALFKEALGLGMLAKSVGGAAKRVAKPAMNAAMGAGGVGAGAQMAAKTVGATAPGALKTVGRAAKSYAKSNPLQAAGLAGGAGLATGAALG